MFWERNIVAGVLLVAIAFSIHSCTPTPNKSEILVSAAISLKNAFEEIGDLFEKQTGIRVRLNLGASGLLQRQIETGAPADVFASAGIKQMDALEDQGLILPDTRRNFARNTLVLIVQSHSQLPIHSFADLADPQATGIAIGNPKTVPAGQYAREALTNLRLWNRIQSRFVLAENVRQVLEYVSHGEVEAGIVYSSDVTIAHGRVVVAAYAPDGSHSPILYPIAVVKETEKRSSARRFIDLILRSEGQAILQKYGFLSPR